MARPNLARRPFADTRPVWLASAALAVVALVLTAVSLSQTLAASGRESELRDREATLRARHAELVADLDASNRRLADVRWARLSSEVGSLREVVAQRQLAWGDLLADLERLVPWDVRLVSINPQFKDDEITVNLTGVAADRDAWLTLLARAFSSRTFSDPVPQREQAPGAGTAPGFQFAMSVRYWPEGLP